jgi:1,2-beta-oligoglucan phosphorylase
MNDVSADRTGARLSGHSGMTAELNANGSLRRFDCGGISLLLFVGNDLEGGPANLYLRRHGETLECTPLLGPQSPTSFDTNAPNGRFLGVGTWRGIEYSIELVLSQSAPAWFWHVQLNNTASSAQMLDVTYAQDLALAPYGAVRMNEFYVSQYIDHTPLSHPTHGAAVASRQNQAADGRHPWSIVGSLRKGASFATDALQFHGLAHRAGSAARALDGRRSRCADPARAERARVRWVLRRISGASSRSDD